MNEERVRPSAVWYVLPVLALVVSIVGAGVQFASEASTFGDRVQSIGADGAGDVELEAGTEPAVWAEFDGATTEGINAPGVSIEVTGPDGDELDSTGVTGRQTWNVGGRAAIKVGGFRATDSGTYHVEVTPADGADRWSVGDLDVGSTIWRVGRWLLIGGTVFFASLITVVVRRASSKRRIRRAALMQGGPFG